ncbi:kinase [Micromonospora sp. RTGN7]|uniref:kinase n=1 Tax=Micromonospora sp. RTGN7 TaxID=3016526 RepID=UPI0029FF097D|nr:kinase [Micromonospora sp. RTGN7]
MRGTILFGSPAVGKDTITGELAKLDSRFTLYRRMKIGEGRTAGYRMTTKAEADALRSDGKIIWENSRYGAVYLIDRPTLLADLATGIPVVHLGQTQAVRAVVNAVPESRWLVVALTCPRSVALERVRARGTGDTEARMLAWDETETLSGAGLKIDTNAVPPDQAARLISDHVTSL